MQNYFSIRIHGLKYFKYKKNIKCNISSHAESIVSFACRRLFANSKPYTHIRESLITHSPFFLEPIRMITFFSESICKDLFTVLSEHPIASESSFLVRSGDFRNNSSNLLSLSDKFIGSRKKGEWVINDSLM